MAQSQEQKGWELTPSKAASRTKNPIRALVDGLELGKLGPSEKQMIALSIGDPTKYPALPYCDTAANAIKEMLASRKFNGYPPSSGFDHTRIALAEKYSVKHCALDKTDIFLTSGCSDALNIAIAAMVSPGDSILLPRPGFSLYRTICMRYNLNQKFYNLDPKTGWECDLEQLESQIDETTKAILINNPSNPCGSVFTRKHCEDILRIAAKHKIPIIADEIYDGMCWEENTPLREISKGELAVPILTCGGLSKQYLLPGWRVGWIALHDPLKVMGSCKAGILSLTQVILGPNSLAQSIIPTLLSQTPKSFYRDTNETLKKHAMHLVEGFKKIPGLTPIKPGGAMYLMVEVDMKLFPGFPTTQDFCKKMLWDERVFVLPGEAFQAPGFFRVVICPTIEVLDEALKRISEFVNEHISGSVHEE